MWYSSIDQHATKYLVNRSACFPSEDALLWITKRLLTSNIHHAVSAETLLTFYSLKLSDITIGFLLFLSTNVMQTTEKRTNKTQNESLAFEALSR